jgi:ribosome-associated translation inhibitor RaiA
MTTDFTFEFYSEVPDLDAGLRADADNRLRELAAGHTDLVGTSIGVEELTGATTPYRYQARVLVYMRLNDVVAVEKDETAEAALDSALDAVERQIREARARLR